MLEAKQVCRCRGGGRISYPEMGARETVEGLPSAAGMREQRFGTRESELTAAPRILILPAFPSIRYLQEFDLG
jgi:hypothetical protein